MSGSDGDGCVPDWLDLTWHRQNHTNRRVRGTVASTRCPQHTQRNRHVCLDCLAESGCGSSGAAMVPPKAPLRIAMLGLAEAAWPLSSGCSCGSSGVAIMPPKAPPNVLPLLTGARTRTRFHTTFVERNAFRAVLAVPSPVSYTHLTLPTILLV